MKLIKLLSIILLTLMVSSACSDRDRNDWDRENLKGKVKVVTKFAYEAVGGIKNKNYIDKRVSFFDKQGFFIKKQTYDSTTLIRTLLYKHNKLDNTTNIDVFTPNKTALIQKQVCKYDEQGRKKEILYFQTSRNTYLYNEQNSDFELLMYSGSSLEARMKVKKNNKGDIIETAYHSHRQGNITYLYKDFEYDEKGNWIKQTEYKDTTPTRIYIRKIEYYD